MSEAPDTGTAPLEHGAYVAELSRQLIGKAAEVRHALIDLAAQAERAPIGSCLSLVEIVCALYYQYLNFDFDTPAAPRRDRVVLSKAQALLVLQPILAELGLLDETAYRVLDRERCRAPGVPDLPPGPGLDLAPRLPGLGLGLAVGRACAAQLAREDWRVYCLLGDGELADGAVWEAAHFAAHYNLGNLVAIVDRNGLTADGPTMQVLDPEPVAGKWMNAGWQVSEINGNKMEHVAWALESLPPPSEPKPLVIVAATASGAGVDFMTDEVGWHHATLGPDDAARAHTAVDAFAAAAADEVKG